MRRGILSVVYEDRAAVKAIACGALMLYTTLRYGHTTYPMALSTGARATILEVRSLLCCN